MFKNPWIAPIACVVVFWTTTVFLAYRLGHAKGIASTPEEKRIASTPEEKRWWRAAIYINKSDHMGTLLIPLIVCNRNPTVFTPEERGRLKLFCEDEINFAEKEIIPALERGDSLEPWESDLKSERRMVERMKTLVAGT